MLLGYLLEQVTGQSYAEVVQSMILDRLGMNLTRAGLLNGRVVVTTPSWPVGGLVSPPEDMALYLRFQLAESRRLNLLKPLVAGGEYAWGWFADETGSWANHSGDIFNGSLNCQTYICCNRRRARPFASWENSPAEPAHPIGAR